MSRGDIVTTYSVRCATCSRSVAAAETTIAKAKRAFIARGWAHKVLHGWQCKECLELSRTVMRVEHALPHPYAATGGGALVPSWARYAFTVERS